METDTDYEEEDKHYCLECRAEAEEVIVNVFKCMKCNFTWEVYEDDDDRS